MVSLVLSLIAMTLITLIQDSASGRGPQKLNCSKWKGREVSASLKQFGTAAAARINCYRTIAGLPSLKLARDQGYNDEENALIDKVDSALSDVILQLRSEWNSANANKAQAIAKANKQPSQEAAKKVDDGATSVMTTAEEQLMTGENFADVLSLSNGFGATRKQYGQTEVLPPTDDWKAMLSADMTMVAFNAVCFSSLNKFVAVAQYNKPMDNDVEKLRKARHSVYESSLKGKITDQCNDTAGKAASIAPTSVQPPE